MKRPILSLLVLLAAALSFAGVTMPAVFSDHMVLQRDRQVKIWGWATPGEDVSVSIAGQKWIVKADSDGDWAVKLEAMPAGGPHVLMVKGFNEIKFSNVMFGDVFICSGQSNMWWTMTRSANPDTEIPKARDPQIRLYKTPLTTSEAPLATIGDGWMECNPENMAEFSAVAYYYARTIRESVDVPIGLIQTAWGGTPVESWMSRPAIRRIPLAAATLDTHLEKERTPGAEKTRAGWAPGGLYNAMIAPFTNYAIAGAIWYQGESNANQRTAFGYRDMFAGMIRDWREAWGQGDFPFYYVQLATFRGNEWWPILRESQNAVLTMPNTGVAVTTDIGNPNDIHPKNKTDVGRRLARWALRDIYKQDIVVCGPLLAGMKTVGNKIEISFDHAGGLKSRDGEALTGFQIAGADQNFVAATAKIVGDKVVVSAPGVTMPKAVRFGWSSIVETNLVNGVGLPASPFRTDSW